MRRVLIFSLVYYPNFVGGAEVAIKAITDRIKEEEITFDMITLRLDNNLPKFERFGNINIHRIGWTGINSRSNNRMPWYININKYFYIPIALLKALSLNKKTKYDLIWSMMATYNSFSALFFKILRPKCHFLLSLQEGDPIEHMKKRAKPIYPIYKMIFKKADQIQVISSFLGQWAKDMGALCPIKIIPNGVNYHDFHEKKSFEKINSLKNTLAKSNDDIFIITTSRLVKKNAVIDIINSLILLPSNIKLLICGVGELERELKMRIEELGLIERVRFLGYVSHDEMPAYLQASDIFIRPSLSEGFGNSFIEAMASGIPVIATPVGGIVDFLIDKETGLFCETNNPKSIASSVQELISDENLKRKIINNADKMVRDKYDWNTVTGEMKKAFLC